MLIKSTRRIYLAGPFFNAEQNAIISRMEDCLRKNGHVVFSPREGTKVGAGLGQTMAERKAAAKIIFDRNIREMELCDYCVALVDGHDAGTMFEIGYLYKSFREIVTYTELLKGLNIMIQECVAAHCFGVDQLDDLFAGRRPTEDFQKFSPEMI